MLDVAEVAQELEEEPESAEEVLGGLFDQWLEESHDPVAEFESQDPPMESAQPTAFGPEPLDKMDFETAVCLTKLINQQDLEVFERASQEYASPDDVFANFRRLSENLGLLPEQVLVVYAQKHWDGITRYVANGIPQREQLDERLADMRVYLRILDLMNVARSS